MAVFSITAETIIAVVRAHAADLIDPCRCTVSEAEVDLGFVRLAPVPWAPAPDISVDYAVMEKAANLSVVPFLGDWSNLGDWASVWREAKPGADPWPGDGDRLHRHTSAFGIREAGAGRDRAEGYRGGGHPRCGADRRPGAGRRM